MIDYNELNEILNYICNELDNSFFLDNLYTILLLSDSYKNAFENKEYISKVKSAHLTYDEVIKLAREIIESYEISEEIKNKYLNEFDKLVDFGILDLAYPEDDIYANHYQDSHFLKIINTNSEKLEINMNLRFSYDDVRVLIHEFTHYMNGYNSGINDDEKNICLNEFVSIYFESYAIKYLKKNYNLTYEELNFDVRILSTLRRARKISKFYLTIFTFITFGNIDENSYKNINDYICGISSDNFNNEVKEVYNMFMKIKNSNENNYKNEIINYLINDFKYFIGTVLTLVANKYSSVNKMIDLNENLNDHKPIDETLMKANIPFNKISEIVNNHEYTTEVYNNVSDFYKEEYEKFNLNVNQKS